MTTEFNPDPPMTDRQRKASRIVLVDAMPAPPARRFGWSEGPLISICHPTAVTVGTIITRTGKEREHDEDQP